MAADPLCEVEGGYIPALKYRWLTPFYDPVLRWMFQENAMKSQLVAEAAIRPGERALDLGCGTGTLAVLLKKAQPQAIVVGLDVDTQILAIARRKATATGVEIVWDHGMAYNLPYSDSSFDVVLTSLMLHHLTHEDKIRALEEIYRILRPGGRFHAADFGKPQNSLMRALAKVSELLEETEDGVEGRLPGMFRAAGLTRVEETRRFVTPLGTLSLYRAQKSSGEVPGRWSGAAPPGHQESR